MLQSLDTEMLEYWTDLEEGQKKNLLLLYLNRLQNRK